MLIRHDPHLSRGRILMPVPLREWRVPSISLPKDQFGNDVIRVGFRLRARLNDGHVVWAGWFEDRDDADAFLYALAAGSLRYERALWDLPVPAWRPDIGENLSYDFATQTILTTTGSNQTYTSPSDWDNSNNTVECLGAGASGSVVRGTVGHSTGGGGGAYSSISNFSFASPGTTTATYNVGDGGASITRSVNINVTGNDGGPTYWNSTVDPGVGTTNAKCSAAGGSGGSAGSGSRGGGAGGSSGASWGQTKYSGGAGGGLTGASGSGGSGGGGAAGPNGDGNAGGSSSSTSNGVTTAGGSADAGSGGSAGTAGGGAGGNGTEFNASYGSGGGGGGSYSTTTASTAGAGGNYGGAGGGATATTTGTATSGGGKQGLIVVTYTALLGSLLWSPLRSLQHILVR